jgi:hypothetical protein
VTARAAAARLSDRLGVMSRSSLYARTVAWVQLAPLVGIVAYAVVLARRVPSLVHDTATSDSVGTLVIAQSLPSSRPGSTVVLGNPGHYTTLWFDDVTRSLPGHRTVWQAMPYVLSLLGLLLLAETVRRLAGGRAALLALAIGIATPPLLLLPQFSQAFDSATVFTGILLAVLLVWLARTPAITAVHVVAGAEAIAVLTGLGIASDLLLVVTGLAPFAAAAALLAWCRRDRRGRELLLVSAAVVVVALVVAGITALAMNRAGYTVVDASRQLASPGRIRDNASLLGRLVLDMANGRLTLHDLGFLGPLRILLGVIAVAGALVPLWMLQRVARDNVKAEPRRHRDAVTAFLAFWGFVALFLALTFVFSRVAVDRTSMRYLVSGFIAIAATVPFVALRGRGTAAITALAVTVSGVIGAVLLQRATLDDFNVQPQHPDGLVAALEAHGLHHGYAGYWQANLLTWDSDGRVISRAVQQSNACSSTPPRWFCPYTLFTVSDWYTPQPGPSFLVRELGGSFVPSPPPPDVRPISVFSYDRYEVYVYDHDIGGDSAVRTTGWPG